MPSTFAWLDHDDNARRRMLEVVDLFREKGTLDELGIGSIRDTLADRLFPGTSTIQTRVRYFLFIPWIYQRIEQAHLSSERASLEARNLQNQLAESLKRGEPKDQRGIIGRQAGESLKRPPATIYWNGLGIWGIRAFPGSIARYHASLNDFHRYVSATSPAESGELIEARRRNWQAAIPTPPDRLLETTDFRLLPEEAGYLADQIASHCGNSLLAVCLRSSRTAIRNTNQCWDLADLPNLDSALRDLLSSGRRFAYLMEGAVLLYNLMLAERQIALSLQPGEERVEHYRAEFSRWADEILAMQDDLRSWNLDAFEHALRLLNPRIPHQALTFCRDWMNQAREDPRSVAEQPDLRRKIEHRERQLKGTALARLHSVRALENWSGASGLGRLDYRWGISQRMIADILDGQANTKGSS